MNLRFSLVLLLLSAFAPCVKASDVILTGGVALRSWENFRGPAAHDNWWANFVRASTIQIGLLRQERPDARITWIVYRPSYVTRSKENAINYIPKITETAKKLKVKLVWVNTSAEAFRAIVKVGKKDKMTTFTYFGHSNPHAFMLDYSNEVIGASVQWMHEKDLAKYLTPELFAEGAKCTSYGCYTGRSMSAYWKRATHLPMRGNTESTRYQPVGDGRLPEGTGKWVEE